MELFSYFQSQTVQLSKNQLHLYILSYLAISVKVFISSNGFFGTFLTVFHIQDMQGF